MDLKPDDLTLSFVPFIKEAVGWADAALSQDLDYLLTQANRRMEKKEEDEEAALIDERLPDFTRDLNRLQDVFLGGCKFKPRIFDMGAA